MRAADGDMRARTEGVTTAARRIARTHNEYVGIHGGLIVFRRDGTGGCWYKDGAYGFGDDAIVVHVRNYRITAAVAQAIIDAQTV